MKRTYLFLIAILFVSAMALVLSTTHVFDERAAKPVYSQKYELELRGKTLPRFHLPDVKNFFSQFAP
ncbi:MAG: hypothetical protein IJ284_00600 [Clostridia bacterium]|nr:hypothetical protein [Clostridia bacterium]